MLEPPQSPFPRLSTMQIGFFHSLASVLALFSRYELLAMVKKNSEMLVKANMEVESASDGKESRGHQRDDLIFFVNKWVCRDMGQMQIKIPTHHTLYAGGHLSDQVLKNNQTGKDRSLSPLYKVVKTVYASPSRINFHLDSTKKVERTPAYPEICFAVDNFDSTFDAVVLTDVDHCYCVLLNAHDGAAFPSERIPQDCSPSDTSSLKSTTNYGKSTSKITLFSGFVSYQMVRDAYDAGRFGRLLSRRSFSQTDRIYMKGPRGQGEAE